MDQSRFLPNYTDLKFEIFRNSDAFLLEGHSIAGGQRFKLVVRDIKLKLKRIQLQDSLVLAIERNLKTKPMLFPTKSIQLRTLSLLTGRRTAPTQHLFEGMFPTCKNPTQSFS
jgi:hypothetical protein